MIAVEAATYRLADDQLDRDRRDDADGADRNEGVPPVERRRDRGAEGDAQRGPDRRPEIVDAERGPAAAGREIVGDDRVGRRNAAGLADPDRHAGDDKLRIVCREAAGDRRRAPQRAGHREDIDPVRPVGEPSDGNGDEAVEQREIQPADQAQLTVRHMKRILDRLGEDREQRPVEEIEDVDAA